VGYAQAVLAQQRGDDVVDVLDAALIKVARLVHVEDLAVQVTDRQRLLFFNVASSFLKTSSRSLLEPGAGQEVEHAARQEQPRPSAGC